MSPEEREHEKDSYKLVTGCSSASATKTTLERDELVVPDVLAIEKTDVVMIY